MFVPTVLLALTATSQAFFFPSTGGSGGGCGCQQAAPACPPPPPPAPCGGGGGYAAPGGYALPRVKRDDETVFDPKCNSEDLKSIIMENIDESTAVAKRNIQAAATDAFGGHIDVICSKGTFSYIVNTELYCETEKEGTTCFAFKQSS